MNRRFPARVNEWRDVVKYGRMAEWHADCARLCESVDRDAGKHHAFARDYSGLAFRLSQRIAERVKN